MNTNSKSPPRSTARHEEIDVEVEVTVEEVSFQSALEGEEDDLETPIHSQRSEEQEPPNLSLFLRHRSPYHNNENNDDNDIDNGLGRHRRELERITLDSASNARHAFDFDDDADSDKPWKWCWKQYQKKRRDRQGRKASPSTATTTTGDDAAAAQTCSVVKEMLQNEGLLPFQQLLNVPISWQTVRKDAIAGTSVAIVAIPLSMSYAKLAGLPPYYGLYANLPACIYPLFGSSRQLAVGPAALVCLLLSSGLSQIVASEFPDDTDGTEFSEEYMARYEQLAVQASFLVAMVEIGMGLLKLGFVTQILSKALISGFTSGAAVMIALSQVKHLLGVNVPPASLFHEAIKNLAQQADNFSWKTFLLGAAATVVLLSLKYAKERNPERGIYKWLFAAGPLLVSGISIVLTYTLDLEDKGIAVVGEIPAGLPKITVDQWTPLSQKLWVCII